MYVGSAYDPAWKDLQAFKQPLKAYSRNRVSENVQVEILIFLGCLNAVQGHNIFPIQTFCLVGQEAGDIVKSRRFGQPLFKFIIDPLW